MGESHDDAVLGEDLVALVAATAAEDDLFDRPPVRAAAQALVEEITMTSTLRVTAEDVGDVETGATPDRPGPHGRRQRRGRRARIAIAAAVALVALGTGAAAVRTVLEARTGEQAERLTETPTGGEWIDLSAPDARDVLLELAEPIPKPPGTDIGEVVTPLLEPGGLSTDDGLQSTIAGAVATCEWIPYWLDAHARGDAAAQAEAQAVLDEVPTWEWIVANDGGGVVDQYRQVADSLRAGDTTAAEQVVAANC